MLGPDPNQTLLKDSTRLAAFLQECLSLGSLRGFKHFETFMRGREELVLCIYDTNFIPNNSVLMPMPIIETLYGANEAWSPPLPTKPFDSDMRHETNKIVFLVTGYSKYRCPYVWLRSHRDKLIKTKPGQADEDNPLQLKKTMEWRINNVALWEIVSEILMMTSRPKNPFEINFDFITELPIEEAILLVGSLVSFLKSIWIESDLDVIFSDLVYKDLQKLQEIQIDKVYEYSLRKDVY